MEESEIPVLRGENDKLKRMTGFSPRFHLRETLQWMFSALKYNKARFTINLKSNIIR